MQGLVGSLMRLYQSKPRYGPSPLYHHCSYTVLISYYINYCAIIFLQMVTGPATVGQDISAFSTDLLTDTVT